MLTEVSNSADSSLPQEEEEGEFAMWRRFREPILVICVLVAACLCTEEAQAQFIAGSYGAGIATPHYRIGGPGWTPSPEALYDERGRVTGSYNPVNGRVQGHGFVPPSASHYGYRNGQLALYVPMDYGLGGVVIEPQNRYQRRHNRRW